MKDRIDICLSCDDLGMNESINHAALDLFERKLLGSASLLAYYTDQNFLTSLVEDYPSLDLGLHFTLTQKESVSAYLELLTKLLLRRFSTEELEEELSCQIKILHDSGIKPLFLDGHYHVHIYPHIWPTIEKFAVETKIFIRVPYEISPFFNYKKSFYNSLCRSFRSIPFFGVGLMGKKMTLENLKKQIHYLKRNNIRKAIWMIHPGIAKGMRSDPICDERRAEYEFIIGESDFLRDHFNFVGMSSLQPKGSSLRPS